MGVALFKILRDILNIHRLWWEELDFIFIGNILATPMVG